jgi:hypothetical protein
MDKAEDDTTHLGFRGEPELVERIDKVAKSISHEMGVTVSRSAVMRMLITRGLDEVEKSAA